MPYWNLGCTKDATLHWEMEEGINKKERRVEAHQKWKGKFGFEAVYRKLVEVLSSLFLF